MPARPDLVVATPGAEPPAEGGYGAALLLDGWAMLSRPDLRVAEETLRRWMAAAALVVPRRRRPAGPGGRGRGRGAAAGAGAGALGPGRGTRPPSWPRATEVGFPPAVRMASVEGAAPAVAEVRRRPARLGHGWSGLGPPGVEVLGPVELDPEPGADPAAAPRERALLRVPRAQGRALAAALAAVAAQRSARKAPDPVRVRLDPPEVG